ncbi:MAG: DUF427 domain-containing protein [Alphaproteobacteria bacterium]|nr:DUF427 domain-containing protein [Alphaproteobacteria bacterium]
MAKAVWNGAVLADSDRYEIVEGNIYFPPETINREFFVDSDHTSWCPWKGEAHYYHVCVNGEENRDAAWYYPETKKAADNIRGHIAFWHGVAVER